MFSSYFDTILMSVRKIFFLPLLFSIDSTTMEKLEDLVCQKSTHKFLKCGSFRRFLLRSCVVVLLLFSGLHYYSTSNSSLPYSIPFTLQTNNIKTELDVAICICTPVCTSCMDLVTQKSKKIQEIQMTGISHMYQKPVKIVLRVIHLWYSDFDTIHYNLYDY